MEGLPVVSHLGRGHILLGKAGEIGNGIPRQKPGQKKVQHHNDQKAHQCKDQILLILFHRCASCVKNDYFLVTLNQLLTLFSPNTASTVTLSSEEE